MKTLRYSVVQFRPFVETGEFANVGIVAVEKQTGLLSFKLTTRRVRRINQFFHDMDDRLFPAAIDLLEQELIWVRDGSESGGRLDAFEFLTKRRESAIIFSEPRPRTFAGRLEDEVDALFDRYVKRTFATEEYREKLLTREIKNRLLQSRVFGYRPYAVPDELLPITFEIASELNGLRIIKPLAFNQKSTVGIVDHGSKWSQRFQLLLERGRLVERNLLVAVSGDTDPTEPHALEAKAEAVQKIRQLGVAVVPADDQNAIVDFARPGSASPEMTLQ